MKTIFISDLHLEEQRPDITQIFLNFLRSLSQGIDALYILGDFFEVWIGDDDLSEFNQMIIHELKKKVLEGLPIFIMHGNRDFLLGKRFLQQSGCQLLPDEFLLNLYGTPTLLVHGDTLCTLDKNYLAFRKKTRKWWIKKLFLLKSLSKRKTIAASIRARSKDYVSTAPDYLMDVVQEDVEKIMQKYNVQHLIHGHTHREAIHHFTLNNISATRIVLGPWHESGSVLICEANGNRQLQKLSS